MPRDTLSRVTRLIYEEHRYDSLPSKAQNKLPYLIQKEAATRGIDITIPFFWYMFGVVAEHSTETTPAPEPHPSDDDLRPIVNHVLQEYYRTSLEDITDLTYEDAPYQVQPAWRELDKKLRTLHDDYHDFYDVDPSREELLDSVDEVYYLFPTDDFHTHESALLDWYSILTRELYAPEFDIERLMQTNLAFWRGVSLTLAETHHHELTHEDIKRNLDIDSFDAERNDTLRSLRQIEHDALDEQFTDVHAEAAVDTAVCDAIVEPVLTATITEE